MRLTKAGFDERRQLGNSHQPRLGWWQCPQVEVLPGPWVDGGRQRTWNGFTNDGGWVNRRRTGADWHVKGLVPVRCDLRSCGARELHVSGCLMDRTKLRPPGSLNVLIFHLARDRKGLRPGEPGKRATEKGLAFFFYVMSGLPG